MKKGFFNDYHGDPPRKRFAKDLIELFRRGTYPQPPKGSSRTIVCYPHFPSKYASISGIAKRRKLIITNRLIKNPLMVWHWEYATIRPERPELLAYARANDLPVLNQRLRDIGKKRVDEAMLKTFGYSTQIDPTQHRGRYVSKSDANSAHDGVVRDEPIPTAELDESRIYQRLIDNTSARGTITDLRVAVFRDREDFLLPCVIVKHRTIAERFLNKADTVEIKTIEEIFSSEEIRFIKAFCHEFGVDHCELDILRDNADQRIYVVDVNNTPVSPPPAPRSIEQEIITRISAAFAKACLNGEAAKPA